MDGVQILSILTLASNIFLGLAILLFLLTLFIKRVTLWDKLSRFLSKNALVLAFIVGLTATLGSLYLSEVKGFNPCKLCWLQRIFMYPLPFILGTALFKKTRDVFYYVLPLSVIGAVIAGYHFYMQMNPDKIIPCSTVGFSVSCSERFFTYYGYITIPLMSLSAFVLITLAMLFLRRTQIGGRK